MELPGVARPRLCPYVITQRSLPSFLVNSERPFSPNVCHRFPPGSVFRIALCVGSHHPVISSATITRKGHSVPISEGSCDIVWTLETDLEAGQLVYLTGDLPELGGWQPKMAVPMHPTEDARLWKAELKTPSDVNFKYNYFIVDKTQASRDISWRPGPEYSLSVPQNDKEDRRILVRDSWLKQDVQRFPAHAWGSWIGEMHLVEPSVSSPAQDRNEIAKVLEFDKPEQLQGDSKVQASLVLNDEGRTGAKYEGAYLVFCDRNQPIEEPWLPIIFMSSENEGTTELASKGDSVKDGEVSLSINSQDPLGNDRSVPAEENSQNSKRDTISTIILINSSICTMQRIAVLEDKNLVELLLEPVNSDALCDSVYVGVVTQLVPRMGGAFVDIGNSRPSFMDMKRNIEPFIITPVPRRTTKGEVGGCSLEILEEPQSDIQVADDSVEYVSPDESATAMSDDHEELENDGDLDILDEKLHINGSVLDYEEVDDSYQHIVNGKKHLQEGAISSSPTDGPEKSDASEVPNRKNGEDRKQMRIHGSKWRDVRIGSKIIVQVVKEGLGTKGPLLTAYPRLRSRFWILLTRCNRIGISRKITGKERARLNVIAKRLRPPGFGLTVRTVAAGHSWKELKKDLGGLLLTWKNIIESAQSAALAADEGIGGAVPVILHRAMGQTLSVVQDYFNEKVKKMVVDSPRTYHEVTTYLQDIAPDLCDRVELYDKRNPLFSEYKIEEEINNILDKRVPLANGGSLVIEQTEALVSIDVNSGHMVFRKGTSREKAVLDVNLAAAKQIARELRLRDIGGIIVVDFIDMADESHKRLVYEEMKRAVERDRSTMKVSELSKHGLMEIIRKRVRPSVTFMISEPCTCCHGTGRVEALETSFSKIEQEICQLLASTDQEADPENPTTWPRFLLMVDPEMCNYLTSGNRTRLAILSSSLKVWLNLKVNKSFSRGSFEVKLFTDDMDSQQSQHEAAISVLQEANARATDSQGEEDTLVTTKKGKTGRKLKELLN